MFEDLLAQLDLYIGENNTGDVETLKFLEWANVPRVSRTRGLQMWVARRLRCAGYYRSSVRRGSEVVRVWRPPRTGPDFEALRELEPPVTIDNPTRGMQEISQWLVRMGWSRRQLARSLDVSPERVRAWIHGDRPVPRMAQLAMRFLEGNAHSVTQQTIGGVDNPPRPCSDTPNVDDDESTRSAPDDTEHPVSPV